MKYLPLVTLFLLIGLSCKKDKKDETTTTTINGRVLNLCTNQTMANIAISFISKGPSGSSSVQTYSDSNGNFTFSNVQINFSDDYKYSVYIESKSGIGSGPEVGFDGVEVYVDKSDLGHYFNLGVAPHFKLWYFYFPTGTNISPSDTITLTIEQKVMKANRPSSIYQLPLLDSPTYPATISNNSLGHIGNYWMGWWHSTLERTKNGVHIVKTDSFYIDWGETRADTIPY